MALLTSPLVNSIFAGRVPLCPQCTSTPEYKSLQAELEKKKKQQQQRQMSPKRQQKFSMAWDAPDQDEEDDAIDEELEKWRGQPLVKPTITFFGKISDSVWCCEDRADVLDTGEKLSDDFDRNLFSDRDKVDMVIVMGTSLRVRVHESRPTVYVLMCRAGYRLLRSLSC